MLRRPLAWVLTAVLLAEAFAIAWLNWFLGVVVGRQRMSLAGLDPHVMSLSSKLGGLLFGLYFVLCALVTLLVAVRGRAPAGVGRVLLVSAAVVHALLGAVCLALIGPRPFLFMLAVLALLVLLLVTYDREPGTAPGVPHPRTGEPGPGASGTEREPRDSVPGEITPPAPTTP
ncbi:hypothetical protein KUM39_16255 [Streptomyces sp. J2-1]|uniref:hypothetical protein n=1 Tax=Streptomyces corallincola TaxID=2851888 RepID=UPI001C37F9C7|nr:hypothetical protein [Streptomyces corallincola]MBV2355909.1 hypothetical protein [Streptomyces corallincola]